MSRKPYTDAELGFIEERSRRGVPTEAITTQYLIADLRAARAESADRELGRLRTLDAFDDWADRALTAEARLAAVLAMCDYNDQHETPGPYAGLLSVDGVRAAATGATHPHEDG